MRAALRSQSFFCFATSRASSDGSWARSWCLPGGSVSYQPSVTASRLGDAAMKARHDPPNAAVSATPAAVAMVLKVLAKNLFWYLKKPSGAGMSPGLKALAVAFGLSFARRRDASAVKRMLQSFESL